MSQPRLFADGWYTLREDAEGALDQCTDMGATPIGIIESEHGSWGLLYWCEEVLFDNHILDSHNAIASPWRNRAQVMHSKGEK